jgi:CBS domain-containing protein
MWHNDSRVLNLVAGGVHMTVAHILAAKPNEIISLHPSASLHDVSKTLAEHRIGAVLMLNDDASIAGIISERDLVRALAKHGSGAMDFAAETFMTRELITCSPEDTTHGVMEIMTNGRVRHLPVMSKGKLAGFISIGDIVKRRIAEVENEAEEMKRYISG